MLFDLRGKRRRTVQATYLTLAVLMGAGLVFFGVGSGTSGGLADLFGGGGGGSTANKTIDKRIERAEKALKLNPKDEAAMVSLVRSHYTLASADTNPNTGQFSKDGKKELTKASTAWERYVGVAKKPDASLAGLMVVAYSNIGLNDAAKAAGAAEIVADQRNDAQAWIQLVQYATLAGQTRKADLAGQKAIEVAPKKQKKAAKQAVEQAKAAGQSGGAGGAGAPATTVPAG
jgi:tetratricopeptide (TPR) repeat protein